jgi:mannitol/fructose-specific phosphotransferase system IIA component (Ntr-type)
MTEAVMSRVVVPAAFTEIPAEAEKLAVITQLAQALAASGHVAKKDVQAIIDGAMAREAIGSTGIGHGIAIPHCRCDLVKSIVCAYGRSESGVDFDSLDGEPVHSVFFVVTPNAQKNEHLALMKNFAAQIRKENFCEFLRQSGDAASLIALLAEFESA